ncbi:hypothetical protein BLNAU_12415 [Blattamonas nauphoetae]|uniref:Uncharacterized protein n=1 Tax=Blattamonas nauphoetae TaxID=2049346 RepID=A0ABQ9XPP5_9EUKA|nr:hypothetical protein BLNAU_12415 [Blattamonas nauphoetae]
MQKRQREIHSTTALDSIVRITLTFLKHSRTASSKERTACSQKSGLSQVIRRTASSNTPFEHQLRESYSPRSIEAAVPADDGKQAEKQTSDSHEKLKMSKQTQQLRKEEVKLVEPTNDVEIEHWGWNRKMRRRGCTESTNAI